MPSKKDKKIRLTPTQKLKEEIKILKNEIDLSKEKNLRIKAEFENYKKRKEKEFSLFFKYEGESVIISILTVLDDLIRLENALSDTKDSSVKKLIDGIHLITNKINKYGSTKMTDNQHKEVKLDLGSPLGCGLAVIVFGFAIISLNAEFFTDLSNWKLYGEGYKETKTFWIHQTTKN